MNKTQVLGIVRHVLTFGAGFLIAKGKLEPGAAESLIGGLLTVIGGVWSIVSPEKKDA
jgi:hypothetical protein